MSGAKGSTAGPEQPFQVVQKRSSVQTRRGSAREKGRSQPLPGEDSLRSKRHSAGHAAKERAESRHQRPAPSSTSPSLRPEPPGPGPRARDREEVHPREAGERAAAARGERAAAARAERGSINRFERLSASEATAVSNRFEALDVESEESRGGTPIKPGADKRHRRHPPKGRAQGRSVRAPATGKPVGSSGVVEDSGGEGDSGVKDLDSSAFCSDGESGEPASAGGKAAAVTSRICYSKADLLQIKTGALGQSKPGWLDSITRDVLRSAPQASRDSEEDPPDTEEARPKHPATLSVLREHANLAKVSLSPQRRSFGSGCSWKEAATPPTVPPVQASTERAALLPEEEEEAAAVESSKQPLPGPAPPSFHPSSSSGPSSRPPRVITHVPLRDQERGKRSRGQGAEGRRAEAKRAPEPEPEWMAGGASAGSTATELREREEFGRELKPFFEEEGSGALQDVDVFEEGEQNGSGSASAVAIESRSIENEFMLDGFDFSTGVSICHELALEDDEEKEGRKEMGEGEERGGEGHVRRGPGPDLSSVLKKALHVGGDEARGGPAVLSLGGQPPHVLTLEEVHATEDFSPAPRLLPADQEQSAFNKLVAVLQSSPSSLSSRQLSSPPHMEPVLPPPIPMPQPQDKANSFGFLLDQELDDSPALRPPPSACTAAPPPFTGAAALGSLARPQRYLPSQGLHSEGGMRPPPPYSQPHYPAPPPAPPPTPPHLERWSDGAWVYPESQPRPPPLRAHHAVPTPPRGVATSRPVSGRWVVEMEQRRLQELHLMRERAGAAPEGPPAKPPNLSLLPTAVVRQLRSSRLNQPVPEWPRTPPHVPAPSPIAGRLDQELTSKASQTRSTMTGLLARSEYGSVPREPHYPQAHGMDALLGQGQRTKARHVDTSLYLSKAFMPSASDASMQGPYFQ